MELIITDCHDPVEDMIRQLERVGEWDLVWALRDAMIPQEGYVLVSRQTLKELEEDCGDLAHDVKLYLEETPSWDLDPVVSGLYGVAKDLRELRNGK